MKSLILIAASATFAAHAGEPKLVSKDGTTTVTPLAGTARTYTNEKGVVQVDMLFQSSSDIVLKGKKFHSEDRKRMAFTGCGKKTGVAFEVDPEGKPRLPDSLLNDEWVSGGNTVLDGMAAIACAAAPPLPVATPPETSAVPPATIAAPPLTGAAETTFPKGIPNLSAYDSQTRLSMQVACSSEQGKGPVAYGACLNGQIASLRDSPGIPNLSAYDSQTRLSMQVACSSEQGKGPVAYGACLRKQVESLAPPRSR